MTLKHNLETVRGLSADHQPGNADHPPQGPTGSPGPSLECQVQTTQCRAFWAPGLSLDDTAEQPKLYLLGECQSKAGIKKPWKKKNHIENVPWAPVSGQQSVPAPSLLDSTLLQERGPDPASQNTETPESSPARVLRWPRWDSMEMEQVSSWAGTP